jgi:hypothetical protein
MVQCESEEDCKHGEWFHLGCESLEAAPVGDWVCSGCAAAAEAVAAGYMSE